MKNWVKFSLSLGMLLLAVVLTVVNEWSLFNRLLLVAMMFSFLGDLFMMNFLNMRKFINFPLTLLGMVAFGLAHFVYSEAFLLETVSVTGLNMYYILGGILFLIMLIVSYVVFRLVYKKEQKVIFLALVPYTLVVGYNMVIITGFSFSTGIFLPFVGIILFIISDILIVFRETTKLKKLTKWIWLFYVIGQTLMLCS